MRVLSLSAYAAQSHLQWQRGLESMFPHWEWRTLALPPRHFSWRVRGNPLFWALERRDVLERGYDLLLATSMVDLATLRGLVPALGRIPAVVYFHENQFEYPDPNRSRGLLEAQMVGIYAALAADRVVFNSAYNRESFLAGFAELLRRLPDYAPAEAVSLLRARSAVIPVPLDIGSLQAEAPAWPGVTGETGKRPLRLLWAGRFEHDKGGERLRALLWQLDRNGVNFELALVGQQFRNSPRAFDQIREEFADRLVQFGYLASPAAYRGLLRGADMVLSTALHEFQGLAVLESVAAGCLPVLPRRLVYPEIYPEKFCYPSMPDDPVGEAQAAAELVMELGGELLRGTIRPPDVTGYGLECLRDRYLALFQAVAG